MAKNVTTRIKIEGESEYRRAIQNCNSEIKTLKSSLALVQSEFKGNESSMEALAKKGDALQKLYDAQKKKVDALQGGYSNAKKALDDYKSSMDQSDASEDEKQANLDALTRKVNDWEQKLNAAKVQLNDINGEMRNNASAMQEAKNRTDAEGQSLEELAQDAKKTKDDLDGFGQAGANSVNMFAEAMIASGIKEELEDIKQALTECYQTAVAFESGMSEVFTLLPGQSSDTYSQMTDDVQDFAQEMNLLTSEVTPALYQAISAGVPADNVFAFLETAQMAAKGGVSDLTTAVDGLTSITNAYGKANLSAQKASDIMFETLRLGKTDFNQLSQNLFQVVPQAVAAGVSFDQVGASLAVMTAQGVPTNVAATRLRQMLVELSQAGSDVNTKFEELSGATFKSFIADGNSLSEALGILTESCEGSESSVNDLFGSVEAGGAALLLTGEATSKFNDALSAMQNASGSTERAYKTMAGTSAEQSKKLETSFEALRIEIGRALIPAFTGMEEAGADALSFVTDFLKQNQWLGPVFSAVATATIALTAAIGAYTVVKKVAIPVITAFNAALNANPAMAIATAITVLTSAVIGVISWLENAGSATDEYTEASRGLLDTIDEANKSMDDATAEYAGMADSAEIYLDRLVELEKVITDTSTSERDAATAKAEYAAVVSAMSELMPELNLEIDEETGLLQQSTDAVRAETQAWIENAQQKAYQDAFAEVLQAQADAAAEVATNEAKLAINREKQNAVSERLAKAQAEYDALLEEENGLTEESEEQRQEYIQRGEELKEQIRDLTEESGELADEETVLTDAIAIGEEALADATEEVEASRAAYDKLMGQMEDAKDVTVELADGTTVSAEDITEAVGEIETELQTLTEEYNNAYTAAYDSITSQMGLFNDMKVEVDTTVSDMIGALDSQIKFMDDYASNLAKAAEMGLSEGLIKQLSDGSVESAEYLQAIVDGGEEKVAELNEKFAKVQEGKEEFSKTMAEAQTDFSDRMDEIQAKMAETTEALDQYEQAYANSADTMDGAIAGAASKMDELRTQFANLALAASDSYNKNMHLTSGTPGRVNGSYASGLDYVPFDGFIAELHRGERILTAAEAQAYNSAPSQRAMDYVRDGGSASMDQHITLEVPIYVDKNYSRKQIVDIAISGINQRQQSSVYAKGGVINV